MLGWLAKGGSIGKVKNLLDDGCLAADRVEVEQLQEVSGLLELLAIGDGRRVEEIIGLEDLSAVCNQEIAEHYLCIELFCQGSLTNKQLAIISLQLPQFYRDIRLSAMIHHQIEKLGSS